MSAIKLGLPRNQAIQIHTKSNPPPPMIARVIPQPVPLELRVRWQQEKALNACKATTVFTSWGKIGDLIYGLAAIKSLGGGILELVNRPKRYDFYSPETMMRHIGELASHQPYINSVRLGNQPNNIDLESFRRKRRVSNLAESILLGVNPDPNARQALLSPWLVVPPAKKAQVVINRSPRYHNDVFPWNRVMAKYKTEAIFVGLDGEYRDFVDHYGYLPRIKTQNVWEVARLISGCELFVGNQSSSYALAEGMKKNTVQEVCRWCPDCIFQRPNAIYGFDDRVVLPGI